MANNNSNNPPGLILPTTLSYTNGAGNPRDSALLAQQNMNMKQNDLNKAVSGGTKRKRNYKGGADANSSVIVPQFQMQYTPQGGPGTNPNNQIAQLSSTNMQSTAWSADDSKATKMGGSKRRRRYSRGGNLDWVWGCYSGGKKKTRRNKNRKSKRKTRHNRRH